MNTQIDHLVVVADTLEQGAAWCQATLGVAPGPGGRHALMGTHNRLLALGGAAFDNSYLEIIAIDPEATAPGRPRWFGMDDPGLQAAVRQQPRLVQAVLRTANIEMLRWGLINLGLPPGDLLAAERPTPSGLLRWRILLPATVPTAAGSAGSAGSADALAASAVPTLIEWQGSHPCDALPPSAVTLQSVDWPGLAPRIATLLRPAGVAITGARPEPADGNDPVAYATDATGTANVANVANVANAANAASGAGRAGLAARPPRAPAALSVMLQTPLGPVQLHTA